MMAETGTMGCITIFTVNVAFVTVTVMESFGVDGPHSVLFVVKFDEEKGRISSLLDSSSYMIVRAFVCVYVCLFAFLVLAINSSESRKNTQDVNI